jgi:hypothetical protein
VGAALEPSGFSPGVSQKELSGALVGFQKWKSKVNNCLFVVNKNSVYINQPVKIYYIPCLQEQLTVCYQKRIKTYQTLSKVIKPNQ